MLEMQILDQSPVSHLGFFFLVSISPRFRRWRLSVHLQLANLNKKCFIMPGYVRMQGERLWLRKHMKKFRRMDWLLVSQCIGRSTKCGGGTRDSVGPFHTSGRPMRVRKTELKIEWPSEERNRTPGCSFIHPDRLAECGAAIRVASR